MEMYNAVVEVNRRDPFDVDRVMAALEDYHPSVGFSRRGFAFAHISLPATSLAQACTTATAVASAAYDGAVPIVADVMTEKEFANREGWGEAPSDLVSVTEAAELLGVSRQAVLDRITRKTLPAQKVGREYVISRSALGEAGAVSV